jgi:hypothetical protein
LLANACANLVHGDWLRRIPTAIQGAIAALFGPLAVTWLALFSRKRWQLCVSAGALFLVVALSSVSVQWRTLYWWNWLVLAIVQIPAAALIGFLCPRPLAHVFIGYRRGCDRDMARLLCAKLEAEGYDCCMDEKRLVAGDRWKSVLRREIRRRETILIFLSAKALEGKPVNLQDAASLNTDSLLSRVALGRKQEKEVEVPPHYGEEDHLLVEIQEALSFCYMKKKRMIPAVISRDGKAFNLDGFLQSVGPTKPRPPELWKEWVEAVAALNGWHAVSCQDHPEIPVQVMFQSLLEALRQPATTPERGQPKREKGGYEPDQGV